MSKSIAKELSDSLHIRLADGDFISAVMNDDPDKIILPKRTTFPPVLRTAFDGLADRVSDDTGLLCLDPTLTQQSFAEEADINTIVNKFLRDGVLPEDVSYPQYGDFTKTVNNYQDALNLVLAADEAFASLPAKVRSRFDNDPAKYVDFFENPANRAEAEALGLIKPRQEPAENSVPNTLVEEGSSPPVGGKSSSSPKGGKKASDDASPGD